MRSKTKLGLAGMGCLMVQAASAQPAEPRPSQVGVGPRGAPVSVESSLAIQLPLAAGSGVGEQIKQAEAARRALYGMAARECAALIEVFKSDCRLRSLRVSSNVQNRGNAAEQVYVTGSASYELGDRPN